MDDMRDGEAVFEEDLEVGFFWRWALRSVFLVPLLGLGAAMVAHEIADADPAGMTIVKTDWIAMAFVVTLLLVQAIVFWRIRIRTRIDGAGVAIRFCVFPPRRIPFSEIAQVSPGSDSLFYVGYGWDPIFTRSVRYGVGAAHRVTFHCRNGWRIGVSTNQPKQIQGALSAGRRRG